MGYRANGKKVRLQVLGRFAVKCGDSSLQLARSARSLVALLAVYERTLGRERAAGILWPDVPTDDALRRLRSALWKTKQTECGPLISTSGGLTLHPAVEVDLDEARLVADRLLRNGDAVTDDDLSLGRFRRDVLVDWYEPWISAERDVFFQVRLHALEAIAAELLERERHCLALEACLMVVDAEPFRETAHRLIGAIHVAEGNPAQALAHFERYRKTLASELRLAPGPQVNQLVESIRAANG